MRSLDIDMGILTELFLTFAKIGLFTFGGGYAMISLIEHHCVERRKWISHDEMMNVTVIAESTPGPIAINCATYIGYKQAGFTGSLAATFGIVLPSFLVISVVSMFLDHFLEIAVVANAFRGIRIAVGILILDAAVTMIRKMQKRLLPRVIMVCSFAAMILINLFDRNFSSITLMLLAGAVRLVIFCIKGSPNEKGGGGT